MCYPPTPTLFVCVFFLAIVHTLKQEEEEEEEITVVFTLPDLSVIL